MSWPVRSVFWVVIVSVSMIMGCGARAVAISIAGRDRPALFDLVATGAMTIFLSPIVWGIGKFSEKFSGGTVPPLSLTFLYVFLISGSVFLIRRMTPGLEEQEAEPKVLEPAVVPVEPRLKKRLSSDMQGEILRLTANGHHIEIVTTIGTQKIRMRFSDAIQEMDPIGGICVHRSHWVTLDAIVRTERENAHKLFVVLKNGDSVPVSRKYRPEFEAVFSG